MNQQLILLAFLYFLNGIPYGLHTKLIPLKLREQQYNLSSISLFQMLSLPWLLKCLVTPYFENSTSRKKKWWILICLFIILMSIVVVNGNITTNSPIVLIVALFTNSCFAALFDINVDSLLLSWVQSTQDIGRFNIMQVVAYKTGVVFTSAIRSVTGDFNDVIIVVQFIYIGAIVLIYFFRIHVPNRNDNQEDEKKAVAIETNKQTSSYLDILITKGTLATIIFCLCYKFSEKGFTSMSAMFLYDQKINIENISFVRGVVSQLFSITGSVIGGLVDQSKSFNLSAAIFVRCIIMLLQTLYITMATNINMVIFSCTDVILYFSSGFITTRTFSIMMMNSTISLKSGLQNTHYALLAAAELFGKLSIEILSGTLASFMGYNYFLQSCVTLDLILFLYTTRYLYIVSV